MNQKKSGAFLCALLTGLLFLIFSATGLAQQNNNSQKQLTEKDMAGTYEIIPKGKIEEIFTTDIFQQIEKRRDDTKEVMYDVSPYTTIRILPR
ncbi:MAG: hypothetical protein ACXVC6_13310, partial [Bacteroidia bacterium]